MGATIVIFAAGMGSRFGGPKQLIPVGPNGESILDYNVHHAVGAGFDHVVVVTRPELVEQVQTVTARAARGEADVHIALQHVPEHRGKPYGTAEAVHCAAPFVVGAFGVANADDLYGPAAFASLARHVAPDGDEGAVVGFRLADTVPAQGAVSRALLSCDDGFVRRIIEVHGIQRRAGGWQPGEVDGIGPLTGEEFVSMNLLALPGAALRSISAAVESFIARDDPGEIYLPDKVGELVSRGELRVRLLEGGEDWAGMTNPEDLATVRAYARDRWPNPIF